LAKKHYYNKLIINSKNKVKTTWCIIKPVTNIKPSKSTTTSISSEGKSYNNPQTMANIFKKYFIKSPNQMQLNKLANVSSFLSYLSKVHKRTFPNINLTPVTSKEIKDIIKSLKWKNSKGYDEIPLNILKISIPFISSPLIYICNNSLSLGIFPTRLKYSQISPIFKKKDRTFMSNYRPISLLTSFSKIFEKVIFNRIKHHIDANNMLAQEQYGFTTKSSTQVATYNLVNNALLALDGKLSVRGLFCDLAKAFDSVNHIVLLSKLEFYGNNGSIGKLIKSYLNDRYQRTLININ
jgi:hypothetical protein